MAVPIKTLPIAERWDCTRCGQCCRGSVIPLSEQDLAKLQRQNWAEHPELSGVKTTIKVGGRSGKYQLARRDDGSCVFLTADGHCRIHAEHGAQAKPLVCRMFPLQVVPQEQHAVLTLRRSCPAAAADSGRELSQHLSSVKKLVRDADWFDQTIQPPAVTRRFRGEWSGFVRVTQSLNRLLTDQKYPLVRRLAHGVLFCSLLDKCRLQRLAPDAVDELLELLEEATPEEAADLFRDRRPPSRASTVLFRQIAVEYMRLHPRYHVTESWRERWRLMQIAFVVTLGGRQVPRLVADLPDRKFSELEAPLGPLPESVQQPFVRFYEANAASQQYLMATRRRWTLTESFRATALAYPVGLCLLRWLCGGRTPTPEDAVEVITMIDRGQGFRSLVSGHHRRRISALTATDQLGRIMAWYSR